MLLKARIDWNAPYSGKTDDYVNYTRDNCGGASENRCDDVKLEQSHQKPIKSAYYHKRESGNVHNNTPFIFLLFSFPEKGVLIRPKYFNLKRLAPLER